MQQSPTQPLDPLSISEIDHRIANNLAMLAGLVRMRARDIEKAKAKANAADLLREAATQIEVAARLHRLLSHRPHDSVLDLPVYLAEVCSALEGACSDRLRLVQTFCPECLLPRDRALPIALIVSEAVGNAAKYAHPTGIPGVVTVTLSMTAVGRLTLAVADDGVGLPEGFDPDLHGGLGFRVIRGLARQIGAEYRFDSTPLGLVVRLDVPI